MRREDSTRGWALSTFELLRFMNKLHYFLKNASIEAMIAPNPTKPDTGLCWNVIERSEKNLEYSHMGEPLNSYEYSVLHGTFAHVHHWEVDGHVFTYAFATNRELETTFYGLNGYTY